jgi:hypothetical protein
MAKDRRRFTPSTEGLEGRAVLSGLFGGTSTATSLTNTIDTLPENFKQKELRIAHLPFFLEQLQPGRFLPAAPVSAIQNDLQQIAGALHSPGQTVANGFNKVLRHPFIQNHLSPDNAKILNHAFGVVIVGAGTSPTLVQDFQNQMNELALVDSKSISGSQLAAQDYSLVLQTVLAVGRPILTPSAPTIALSSGKRIDNGQAGLTRKEQPTLVGTYTEGASKDGSTTMQLFDQNGDLLGIAPVDASGKYSITVAHPLADGVYRLSVRAVEPHNLISAPSKAFALRVKSLPPRVLRASEVHVTVNQTLN